MCVNHILFFVGIARAQYPPKPRKKDLRILGPETGQEGLQQSIEAYKRACKKADLRKSIEAYEQACKKAEIVFQRQKDTNNEVACTATSAQKLRANEQEKSSPVTPNQQEMRVPSKKEKMNRHKWLTVKVRNTLLQPVHKMLSRPTKTTRG